MNLANMAECQPHQRGTCKWTDYFEMFTSFMFEETSSIAGTAQKDSFAVFVKIYSNEIESSHETRGRPALGN